MESLIAELPLSGLPAGPYIYGLARRSGASARYTRYYT